jgi:putative transposase
MGDAPTQRGDRMRDVALMQRKPTNVIHQSDQGSQYTSVAFGLRYNQASVRPRMGSVGDAFDNAISESLFATLECKLLDRRKFKTKAESRMVIFKPKSGSWRW